MKKQYYDHRSKLCAQCFFHHEGGPKEGSAIRTEFPEGCNCYGYSFHPDKYEEDAEDCPGFETPARHMAKEAARAAAQKQKNRK